MVKCWAKLVSFISFILPIYHKVAAGFQFLSSLSKPGPYKQEIIFSNWQSYNPLVWVALQNRTHIVNISSTFPRKYVGPTLPKSRPRSIKNNSLTVFININNIIATLRTLNEVSFFCCQKLSSQVYLALASNFLKIIYYYPFHTHNILYRYKTTNRKNSQSCPEQSQKLQIKL